MKRWLFATTFLGWLALFSGCIDTPTPSPKSPTIDNVELLTGPIPDREIVFYATEHGPNVLGFINSEGGEPIFRRIPTDRPLALTNYVRWSDDGQMILGRLAPTINPNAAYPMLITSEGDILYCEFEGGGYVWSVSGTQIITGDTQSDRVLLIDMKDCEIISVIYENPDGFGTELVVSEGGLLLVEVASPQNYLLIDIDTGEVLTELKIDGKPIEWASDGETLIVKSRGDYIVELEHMTIQHTTAGGWLSLSPDDSAIIFTGGAMGMTLTVKDLSTGVETEIYEGGISPSWRRVP